MLWEFFYAYAKVIDPGEPVHSVEAHLVAIYKIFACQIASLLIIQSAVRQLFPLRAVVSKHTFVDK